MWAKKRGGVPKGGVNCPGRKGLQKPNGREPKGVNWPSFTEPGVYQWTASKKECPK